MADLKREKKKDTHNYFPLDHHILYGKGANAGNQHCFGMRRKHCEKRENAGNQHLLPFILYFYS